MQQCLRQTWEYENPWKTRLKLQLGTTLTIGWSMPLQLSKALWRRAAVVTWPAERSAPPRWRMMQNSLGAEVVRCAQSICSG